MALFARRPVRSDDEDEQDGWARSTPATPVAAIPPIQLRDWEIPVAYVVAAFVALVAVLELTVTTGKGAPKHADMILPGIAVVAAVAQVMSVRFKNRLITGILGIVGGLTVGYSKTPDSLSVLREVGLFVPFVYGFAVTQRQSKAQRALGGPRRSRRGRAAGAAPAGRGAKTSEPAGPAANRRYTPPKPKQERDTRRR